MFELHLNTHLFFLFLRKQFCIRYHLHVAYFFLHITYKILSIFEVWNIKQMFNIVLNTVILVFKLLSFISLSYVLKHLWLMRYLVWQRFLDIVGGTKETS